MFRFCFQREAYVLAAGVRNDSLVFANKELHPTIVIFGVEFGLGVGIDLVGCNQEPETGILRCAQWTRFAQDSFDGNAVNTIGGNDNVWLDDIAIVDGDGRLFCVLLPLATMQYSDDRRRLHTY